MSCWSVRWKLGRLQSFCCILALILANLVGCLIREADGGDHGDGSGMVVDCESMSVIARACLFAIDLSLSLLPCQVHLTSFAMACKPSALDEADGCNSLHDAFFKPITCRATNRMTCATLSSDDSSAGVSTSDRQSATACSSV